MIISKYWLLEPISGSSSILFKNSFSHRKLIGESNNKYKILGLNLLFLLSQNRVADFHTELELLPAEIIQKNIFIRYPLALEQYIMEGRYNKIFVAKVKYMKINDD